MQVLEELERTRATASADASRVRARQLAMVTGELVRYLATQPDPPAALSALLSGTHLSAYLTGADDGLLAARPRPAHRAPSPATARVRRSCLNALARTAGLPPPCPTLPATPAPPAPPETGAATLALDWLRGKAAPANATAWQVRAALIASLVAEAGLRPGELAQLHVHDLHLHRERPTLTYTPCPPATRTRPDATSTPLSASTATIAARWLTERQALAPARVTHLILALSANHDGAGHTRPTGMPLHATGIRRAHASAMRAANLALAGAPGYPGIKLPPSTLRATRAQPGR